MTAIIPYSQSDVSVYQLDDNAWHTAETILLETYWSGEVVPSKRRTETKLLSCNTGLSVRFEVFENEESVISSTPNYASKTIGLWERDVCEIFIAPDRNEPKKYFEFEVAPTGEWLDLAIDMTSGERVTNWEYNSEMEVAARIENGKVSMAMKIPWEAFGRKPKAGDVWLGNIFRCVGKEPDRGYLAWQPTMTEKPNFHVPEAFGEFHFV